MQLIVTVATHFRKGWLPTRNPCLGTTSDHHTDKGLIMIHKKDRCYILEAVIELIVMIKLIKKGDNRERTEPKTAARLHKLQGDDSTDQVANTLSRQLSSITNKARVRDGLR